MCWRSSAAAAVSGMASSLGASALFMLTCTGKASAHPRIPPRAFGSVATFGSTKANDSRKANWPEIEADRRPHDENVGADKKFRALGTDCYCRASSGPEHRNA